VVVGDKGDPSARVSSDRGVVAGLGRGGLLVFGGWGAGIATDAFGRVGNGNCNCSISLLIK
jgi:hypothetical protein